MRRALILLAMVTWIPASAGMTAAEPVMHDITPGVVVVGWDRLSADAQGELRRLLDATPRALTPWLRVITIDGAAVPQPLAAERCAPNGEVLYAGPCGFNIWSSTAGGEDPFPPDAPERVWVDGFVAVTTHEYGHQIGHGTAVDQPWVDRVIAEAGADPRHYLRSMLPWGFFMAAPQELLASMWNQWGTCSICTLRLALARWDIGIPHPLNQTVLLLALSGFRHGVLDDAHMGTVVAHRLQDGVPAPEIWSVWPWRCGGPSTISGPGFAVTLTTDEVCHVVAVGDRRGI